MADTRGRKEPAVYSITSAATPHSEELGSREKKYAISMGIRTLCFIGAVVVPGPMRWVLVAAAVFLPYTSVILANAGVRRRGKGMDAFDPNEDRAALESGDRSDQQSA